MLCVILSKNTFFFCFILQGSLPPLTRPWTSPVPPLTKKLSEKRVLFPTEDESVGTVTMGWRGPSVNVS